MRSRFTSLLTLCAFLGAAGCDSDAPSAGGADAEVPVSKACFKNDHCPLGQVCVDNECRTPECTSKDQCPADHDCVGFTCVASAAGVDAGGCKANADCPECHACSSIGACIRIAGCCVDIADCSPGYFCDLALKTCMAATPDGGIGGCPEGATRSCGESKLGECRFGVQTCFGGVWVMDCSGAIYPQQESCDQLDNDCDGQTDEDFQFASDPQNCGDCGVRCTYPHAEALCVASACQMGACEPDWHDLANGAADGCEYYCQPSNGGVEICDVVDNDCDGQTDEGFDVDQDGLTSCSGDCNDNDPLAKPGAPERCNGHDDDCDLAIDEGFDVDGDLLTSCAGDCNDNDPLAKPGAPERCNGQDDDCDSAIDEDLGQTPCGVGACATVQQNCVNGQPRTCAPLAAGTESCNGADDDCDGLTDEDLGETPCGVGACATRVQNCVAGVPQTCVPGTAVAEACDNGADDDCDGSVDENPPCACSLNSTQACYSGTLGCTFDPVAKRYTCVGACATGTQTCVAAGSLQQWGTCTGSVVPATEVCNGRDDDCDGSTDELLGSTTCGVGACARTVQNCQNGAAVTCTPGAPGTEVCNGLDDDCDGTPDDNLGSTTCGQGICARTQQNCVSGRAVACVPGASTAETCNGLDDDCDGTPDDSLGSTPCGVGACAKVQQNCVNGQTQTCTPGAATAETCDGVDNNCNGTVDDVTPATKSCGVGACATTVQACVGGVDQTCTPKPPSAEVCNAVDDDCDGSLNEDIPSVPCTTTARGVCQYGHTVCVSNTSQCVQNVQPTNEICNNGLDEDCNGTIDDPSQCGCDTRVDVDLDGSNECVDCDDHDGARHPGAAEGLATLPSCDGKDNDCDGTIDEGFDVDGDGYTRCGTIPTGGLDPTRVDCDDAVATTNPGVTCDCEPGCTINPMNLANRPDGKDNNCNGRIDETCNCQTTDNDGDGVTGCAGDCNNTDRTVKPGAPELCDGKDNDCNTMSVENCDVGETCNWPDGTDECKDRLVCAQDIGTKKYTCGSFCNTSQAAGGLGDGCRAGESCAATLILSDNDHLCTASGTTGTGKAGDTCRGDGDCKSNSCLSPGFGLPKTCSDLCGSDAYCANTANPATCVVGYSADSVNPEYSLMTARCLSNAYPYEGTLTTGQSCTAAGTLPPQCKWGDESCVNGKCAAPCCKNSDCPAGYFCNGGGMLKRIPAYYQIGTTSCNADRDCPSGTTCYAAAHACARYLATGVPACTPRTTSGARRVAGAACSSNADCDSQFCERTNLGGVCVDMCCNDAGCANGTRCEYVSVQMRRTEGTTNYYVLESMRACVHVPVFEPASGKDPQLVWDP